MAIAADVGALPPPRSDHERELGFLYEIIHAVNSSLELDRVLAAIVRLVNDAIVAHATYVFLVDDGGRRLTLRAASPRYAHLCGRVTMETGEGIAGWVLENRQPVFIPENALSDPRIRYFPEFEEEKYQSLVSVPLIVGGGEVIGVIALHAEAPRVFSSDDAAFLIHTASLVAQAVQNARLYERTRRAMRDFEQLSRLGLAIARADTVDQLLLAAVEQGVNLLGAASLRVYLLEPTGDQLRLRAASDGGGDGPDIVSLPELGHELRRASGSASVTSLLASALWGSPNMLASLVAPLVAGDEVLGFVVARLPEGARARERERDVANFLASQTAVGLARLQLTDRLAERNLIKDLLDDLQGGEAGPGAITRLRRLGIDAAAAHAVVLCRPAGSPGTVAPADHERFAEATEAAETMLVRIAPGTLVDRRDEELRAIVPLGAEANEMLLRIESGLRGLAAPLTAGISSTCDQIGELRTGFAEAHQAALAVPVVGASTRALRFDALGLFKYLLRAPLPDRVRDRHTDALRRLRDHDRRRRSQLLATLEEFVRQRGNMAATAKALYVHPNTLRQRLRRIRDLTGLDARTDDWLMIEIACRLLELEEVYPPTARPDRSGQ